MKRRLFIVSIIFAISVQGCIRIAKSTEYVSTMISPSTPQNNSPIQNNSEILSDPVQEVSNSVDETADILSDNVFSKCVTIESKLHNQEKFGSIILSSANNNLSNLIFSWNTNELISFQKENYLIYDLFLSPDGNWLAFDSNRIGDSSNEEIVAIYLTTDEVHHYPSDNQYPYTSYISGWRNNQELLISTLDLENKKLDFIRVLNPITGQMDELSTDYPEIINRIWEWRQQSWPSVTIYSPSLDYVVYMSDDKPGEKFGDYRLVLFDRQKSQAIANIDKFGSTMVYPLWKSDSSGFYYVLTSPNTERDGHTDEWYFMNVNGVSNQLTQIQKKYTNSVIYGAKISPDEEKIAFELLFNQSSDTKWQSKLLVLDIASQQITDYCISIEHLSKLVWSVDSNYIAHSEKNVDEFVHVNILDLNNFHTMAIGENMRPEVWTDKIELNGYFPQD